MRSTLPGSVAHPFHTNGAVERAFYGSTSYTLGQLGALIHQVNLGGADAPTDAYKQSIWVYACARIRANAVATPPLRLWDKRGDEDRPVENSPLIPVLAKPNPWMTGRRLQWLTQLFKDLDGGCIWVLRKRRGDVMGEIEPGGLPDEIYPVRGSKATPQFEGDGITVRDYSITLAGGRSLVVPRHSAVAHLDPDPDQWQTGFGPADACLRQIGIDFQLDRYDEAMARRAGLPSVVFQAEAELSPSQVKEAQQQIQDRMGRDHTGLPVVLGSGVKPVPLGHTAKDMTHPETRVWTRDAIMAAFGVTKPLLGITDDVNRANAAEAMGVFWDGTAIYLLRDFEDDIQCGFLSTRTGPEKNYSASFDVSEIPAMQESLDAKVERTTKIHALGVPFAPAAKLAGWEIEEGETDDGEGPNVAESAAAPPEQVLNGAQIQQLVAIVQAVQAGMLPLEAGVQIVVAAFPFDDARARLLFSGVVPGSQPPAPPPNTQPPSPPGDGGGDDEIDLDPDDDGQRMAPGARRAAFSLDALHRATAPLLDKIAKRVRQRHKDYLLAYRRALDDFAKANRAGKPSKTRASEAEIVAELQALAPIVAEFAPKLGEQLRPILEQLFKESADRLAKEIGASAAASPLMPETAILIAKRVRLVEGTVSTLSQEITDALAKALVDESGFSVGTLGDAVRERLEELVDLVEHGIENLPARASTIAQTEVTSVQGAARHAEMRANGVKQHRWHAEPDAAVRESHAAIHGKEVEIGQTFIDGITLRHEGDPEAPVGEIVNCRCATVPVIGEDFDLS